MKVFFDSIARAFESIGVHPVLGAFIVGATIAYLLTRRRSVDAELPDARGHVGGSPPLSASFKANLMDTNHMSLTVDGRTVEIPAEVLTHIRAGNKIAAIKVLHVIPGVDLKSAKQIVEQIAASPIAR